MPALRKALDEHPQLWQEAGDPALNAERSLVELAASPSHLLRESLVHKLHSLRDELSEPGDPPLLGLLVQRVVLGWLELHHVDALVAQLRVQFGEPAQVRALEQRRDSSQRRYLAAIKVLAQTRKLLARAPAPVEVATRLAGRYPAPPSQRKPSSPRSTSVLN